jgi:hypothetical protein
MGFSPIHPLVSFAKRAEVSLDLLHHPEDRARLVFSGFPANETFKTLLRHGAITVCDGHPLLLLRVLKIG